MDVFKANLEIEHNFIKATCNINDINVSLSLTSTQQLKLHFEHFVKHNVEGDYSWNEEDQFEEFIALKEEENEDIGDDDIVNLDEDDPIEDLSDSY